MEPKTELLVFNKKEVSVIVVLLVLVALFSFTLGLKMGKMLGSGPQSEHHTEEAPLAAHQPEAAGAEHAAPATEHSEHSEHGDAHEAAKEVESAETIKKKVEDKTDDHASGAEDHADAEFAHETKTENVHVTKPVPMALPKEKKSEAFDGPRYTLQVGSHRTVAEAAEQVSAIKRSGLDAFYIEAKVPGKGTWYRVGIGLFTNKEVAEQQAAKWKIQKKPLPSFIVQKINE